jgi:hypothetical protein
MRAQKSIAVMSNDKMLQPPVLKPGSRFQMSKMKGSHNNGNRISKSFPLMKE